MKVFLDIGAHSGETLTVAQHDRWRFGRLYSFEPAPQCWSQIEAIADERTTVCRFGLFDRDCTIDLHNAGSIGASVSEDKDGSDTVTACDFRDAAAWLRENISETDEVFAKINVEGSEYEIIKRLYDTDTLPLIDHLLIHFDVRKVPSRRHLEAELRSMLEDAQVDWVLAERVIFGSVSRGTRNWLERAHAPALLRPVIETARRVEGQTRVRLAPLKTSISSR